MADITPLKKSIKEAFPEGLNQNQLWALVKFAKWVRLRARNNAAFNNVCNALFDNARFSTVKKTRKDKYTGKEVQYDGLRIDVQGEETKEVDESEE